MAFDGITTSNIVFELNNMVINGKLDKIYQPEPDEIIFVIKNNFKTYRLLFCVNSQNSRVHLISQSKKNPLEAPMFCMVLRKHLGFGKITKIVQPDFERIIFIYINSFDELGVLKEKKFIIEIMGKHSNIILVDENDVIIDCIKKISLDKSSIRPVLPNLKYFLPQNNNKVNPLLTDLEQYTKFAKLCNTLSASDLVCTNYNGISKSIANFIFKDNYNISDDDHIKKSFEDFYNIICIIKENKYSNKILYSQNKICDFVCIDIQNKNFEFVSYLSANDMLDEFYFKKNSSFSKDQQKSNLSKLINKNLNRCFKKCEIFTTALKELENYETSKLFGELILSNIYNIKHGDTILSCISYYDNTKKIISLDKDLSPSENAQKYFKKYNKDKKTIEYSKQQLEATQSEILYLESILTSLSMCSNFEDMLEIHQELYLQKYINKKIITKKNITNSKKFNPIIFMSSDGFEIFVGKNNHQNDELTLKFAKNSDIWLHTKVIPGSHVIIKTNNLQVPEKTLLEAANIAAFYSKSNLGSNVPVDYTLKKHVKKPSGAKPGMVIYDHQKTVFVTPDESFIEKLKK